MKWRDTLFLICAFVLSVLFLAVVHITGDPAWLVLHLPASMGGDGILWQVQTTFLSVGFAGLAIAAQLFAEAPLAVGASRGRVLDYIGANWFVGVGLVANAVIAIETIWLPSSLGLLVICLAWFTPTVALLVASTARLARLFGNPSRLDEVVRLSLVQTLSDRLEEVSRKHAYARKELDQLVSSDRSTGSPSGSATVLRVPVPEVGRVIRAVKPKPIRQAITSLAPRASEDESSSTGVAEEYVPPQVTLYIDLGDRTRLGETAFRVVASKKLDPSTSDRVVRLLQSSIEFDPDGSVTPYEESDREIANLKDAIGTNLRSGALATAERALELLGHVVREVWMTESERLSSSRRASITRRDWLFRSIGEAEQDALLSPRVAGMFIGAAMTRALEAPRTGSMEYVEECLRSFLRLWLDILRYGGGEYDLVPSRVVTCVQNLAVYAYSSVEGSEDLQARATWVMVELVKLALDAKEIEAARMAAEELSGLFEYEREGSGRARVRAGQLVLSGWLDYLTDKQDDRASTDSELRSSLTPRGTWSEIVEGRSVAERDAKRLTRWDWWEMKTGGTTRAQSLELSDYVDRAQVAALATSHGRLPVAENQESASEYERLLRLLDESDRDLTAAEQQLREKLAEVTAAWDTAEHLRLAQEPLSEERTEALRSGLRETLREAQRLAAEIPTFDVEPDTADVSRPILGMNFRIPRHYLVEKIFNQTYADPAQLGQVIARGFAAAEERKILAELRALQDETLEPTAFAVRRSIDVLEDQVEHFVLLTPYGGLGPSDEWYSAKFQRTLDRVTHLEAVGLEGEALLFDRRTTLGSRRLPEEKTGLSPIEGTSIALGVFEDVEDADEPQLRVETGEYFVLWPGTAPNVLRFGHSQSTGQDPDGEVRSDA